MFHQCGELLRGFAFGVVAAVLDDFQTAAGDAAVRSLYGMKSPNSLAAVSCCSSSVINAKPARLLVRDSLPARYIALARCHIRAGDREANACNLAISAPRSRFGSTHSIPDSQRGSKFSPTRSERDAQLCFKEA